MIVLTKRIPVLVDREALAMITGRSVHTIRARCTVARRHWDGSPLYNVEAEVQRLAKIPTRRRGTPGRGPADR